MLRTEDIEIYWRVRNNPYRRNGMRLEDAIIFCDLVDHAMKALTEREQMVLRYYAAGYTANEVAAEMGLSLRTVTRQVRGLRLRDDIGLPRATRGLMA